MANLQRLQLTKIPPDDILEGLCKLRIRESEKPKTVLELYNMEIHQKKAGPDYHKLKTLVKRSFEQNLRIKNFGARNGIYETNAVVKNQGTKQRKQRSPGECWQWKATGQCSKGDNCSFRHDNNQRTKRKSLNLQNKKKDEPEARKDFWSIQGDFVCRHHIEPRVQLYVPKEETFPIPMKCIDVTRSTFSDLDIAQEKKELMIIGTPMETKICQIRG